MRGQLLEANSQGEGDVGDVLVARRRRQAGYLKQAHA